MAFPFFAQTRTRLAQLALFTLPLWAQGPLPAHAQAPMHADLEQGSDAPGVVNLNTASAEELERLPGVGPSRAEAILKLRTQIQRFSRVEQLMRVKGIGRATFRKLRPLLTLEGETTLPPKSGRSRRARSPNLED